MTVLGAARRSKLTSLEAAAVAVADGDHVALGGIWSHNAPSALVRALIRRGARDLTVSAAPAAGFAAELLIAAGCVRTALVPNVTFEQFGLAPGFRRAVQAGELELIECDEPTLVAGYRAAAAGLPSQPVRSVRGTALAAARPDLRVREVLGERVHDVAAIVPDVVFLHAARGDAYGNLQQQGAVFADRLLAKAASRTVIATVDELVDNAVVRRAPVATTVPSYLVTGVVEAAFGSHPCSSHGCYRADEEHLAAYIAGVAAGGVSEYVERFVRVADHGDYLDAVGGVDELEARLGERWP